MTTEAFQGRGRVMTIRRAEPWEEQFRKDLHYLFDNMEAWTQMEGEGKWVGVY